MEVKLWIVVLLVWYRVLDHDTYSAHDAIGKVYIDLNPLLIQRKDNVISGWYPIYDTMHGTLSSSLSVTYMLHNLWVVCSVAATSTTTTAV